MGMWPSRRIFERNVTTYAQAAGYRTGVLSLRCARADGGKLGAIRAILRPAEVQHHRGRGQDHQRCQGEHRHSPLQKHSDFAEQKPSVLHDEERNDHPQRAAQREHVKSTKERLL